MTEVDLEQRDVVVEGRVAHVSSSRVGGRFSARVESDDGIVIRARGASREEAERTALNSAAVRFGLVNAREALKKSVEHLGESR